MFGDVLQDGKYAMRKLYSISIFVTGRYLFVFFLFTVVEAVNKVLETDFFELDLTYI